MCNLIKKNQHLDDSSLLFKARLANWHLGIPQFWDVIVSQLWGAWTGGAFLSVMGTPTHMWTHDCNTYRAGAPHAWPQVIRKEWHVCSHMCALCRNEHHVEQRPPHSASTLAGGRGVAPLWSHKVNGRLGSLCPRLTSKPLTHIHLLFSPL